MAFYNAGLFLVLFLSLFLMLLLGGRMSMRGALPMLYLFLGIGLWSLCQLLHIFVVDPQAKYFWYQAKFVGIVMVAPSYMLLAAEISGLKERVRTWHKALLVLFMLTTLVVIATDSWTHLFREKVEFVIVEQYIVNTSVDGPAFWIYAGFSYLLVIASLILLGNKARRSSGKERRQALIMFAGCALPWISNMIFITAFNTKGVLDYTPLFMLITEIVFLITLFYFRLFNIVPFTKRAVYDSLEDLILVVGHDGVIQDMNPAAREVFQGSFGSHETVIQEFMQSMSPPYRGCLEELQGTFQAERHGRTKDYKSSLAPIYGNQGSCMGYLLVFNDITDFSDSRRALEMATKELDRQNEKKMLFVKQVNRNIRAPLNRVLGFADIFAAKDLTDSQREAVEHLVISGGHLIKLINDITDYSKIETGRMEIKEESVQIFDLVRHVCKLYEYPAEQKGIQVKYSIASDVPVTLLADPLRLTQVLSNLMGNAVKFTDKGHVSLSVRRTSHEGMDIAVSDTGIGISESDMGKLFIPYQQAGEGKTQKFGGTGLGLAIVKDLVERMGGEISVESILGEGSTFRLKLPCRESQVKSPVYNLEMISDFRKRPLHVGILTYDTVQQTLIRRFFRNWPMAVCYDLTEAEDGAVTGNNKAWDIVLVNLDDFEGAAVKERFNQRAIIGFTNDSDTMERETQGRSVLDDCILMPLSFEVLNRAIRKTIFIKE